MKYLFTIILAILLLGMSFGYSQVWHQYNYPDTAAVSATGTSFINVRANDDMNPPIGSWNFINVPVICDYPWPWGSFTSEQGGTWAVFNNDSVTYNPPSSWTAGWDRFMYATCEQGNGFQYDTARVFVFVDTNATALQNPSYLSGISIYPNPVQQEIRLDGPNVSRLQSVAIYGIDGREVVAPTAWTGMLATEDLPAGLYLFQLRMGGEIHHLRFAKE